MDYRKIPDAALLARARALARDYQAVVAELVAVISEIERRKLYIPANCSSAFEFCVHELELSEDDAAKLLRSARAAAQHPEVLSFLSDGSLTVRAVAILSPDAGKADFVELLDRAKDQPLRTLERIMAERHPEAAPREHVRIIAAEPNSGRSLYRLAFNADDILKGKLDRLRDLLSRRVPSGRLEDLIDAVTDDFLAAHDPLVRDPVERRVTRNPESRRVPPSVRDIVWRRDGGRCSCVNSDGSRCDMTRWLELDRVKPWASGGRSDDPDNIRLLCREHNQSEARRVFG